MFLRQAACQAALQSSERESGSGPTADPHCNSWKHNLARTAHLGAGLLHQLQQRGAALRRAAVDEAGPQRAQVPLQRLEAVLQPPPGAAPRLELALLLRRPYEDGHLRDAQQRQILAGARLCPGCGGSTGAGSLLLETAARVAGPRRWLRARRMVSQHKQEGDASPLGRLPAGLPPGRGCPPRAGPAAATAALSALCW